MIEILFAKGVSVSAILNAISSVWSEIIFAFGNIGFFDVVDILVVAYVIYKCIDLFKETRSGQLIKGIVILLLVYLIANWCDMVTVKWILIKVFEYAIVALAVIFQPEIRRALEKMGRSNLGRLGKGQSFQDERSIISGSIDAVCKAATVMHENKTGALMVFEKDTLLGDIIDTGTVIDAEPSAQLIDNIFYPKSPLHDGAAVLRAGRIIAAGCILPLSPNENLAQQYGTRHRAALGMSENSDAVVVVVSEETGGISVAVNGKIASDLTPITLREQLNKLLLTDQSGQQKHGFLRFGNAKKELEKGAGKDE